MSGLRNMGVLTSRRNASSVGEWDGRVFGCRSSASANAMEIDLEWASRAYGMREYQATEDGASCSWTEPTIARGDVSGDNEQ